MKKYDKIFVPVFVTDADRLFVADEDRYEKHGVIEYVKEQTNVIVLTQHELWKLIVEAKTNNDNTGTVTNFLKQRGLSE